MVADLLKQGLTDHVAHKEKAVIPAEVDCFVADEVKVSGNCGLWGGVPR